jgi:hypothetical protein
MDMLFELMQLPIGQGLPWTPYMLIFFKRLLDAGYVAIFRSIGISISVGGVETTPAFLLITEKGREFVTNLGLNEL